MCCRLRSRSYGRVKNIQITMDSIISQKRRTDACNRIEIEIENQIKIKHCIPFQLCTLVPFAWQFPTNKILHQ